VSQRNSLIEKINKSNKEFKIYKNKKIQKILSFAHTKWQNSPSLNKRNIYTNIYATPLQKLAPKKKFSQSLRDCENNLDRDPVIEEVRSCQILPKDPDSNTQPKFSSNKDLVFSISAWNTRSLNNPLKMKKILEMKDDIILIQEIWSPNQTIIDTLGPKTCYVKKREDGYGGTMLINNNPKLTPLNEPMQINKDSNIVKINVGGDRNIWIGSIYIHKKLKRNLLDTFGEIQQHIPTKEWPYLLLGGDWNIDIRDGSDKVTQTLQIICNRMGLSIISCDCLRKKHEIDFFIIGKQIDIADKGNKPMSESDHNCSWIKIKVQAPPISLRNCTIPNKKLANKITQECLEKCHDGIEFSTLINNKYKYNRKNLYKTIKQKENKNEVITRILTAAEEIDTLDVIKEYWREKNEDCENDMLENRLQKAFHYLKKITKFHEYKRRDGSIINKVKKEDNTITLEQNEVNQLVLENLSKVQTSSKEPTYQVPIPFPQLEPLSISEMDYILSKLFSGKAISFDGTTDIIFSKENKPKTANKLNNIWNSKLNTQHFDTRLIPLNKVHPDTPTPKDCRPIAVCSSIIKLLESRSRKKLEDYMVQGLHRGQTGFVPGMGITVNQMRMVQRVKEITIDKKHCYGLFIDFSSAYNTILHTKLYQRLEKALTTEEIQLIKAIYSRTNIKLGNHSFNPNIGVAQGSIISPFLFNIYSEDLYHTLEKEANIPYQDLMGYADDLLIICTTPHQLRQAINCIQRWSVDNNLLLNAKKSGIIEFLPRAKTYPPLLKPGTSFEGIPVVSEYKYLGFIVDQKLTTQKQLQHIEDKTKHQCAALWAVLKAFSLTERIHLWTILTRPLFEMLIFPYYAERSKMNIEKVHKMLRKTFKKFCLFKKNINNETIERLMNYNFTERAGIVVETTKVKWTARMNHEAPDRANYPKQINTSDVKTRTWYPKETVELINLKSALCKSCNIPCSSQHLQESHSIVIPSNKELLDYIESKSEELLHEKKLKKREILNKIGESIQIHINKIKTVLV